MPGSPLTRALGRPIRDQVYSVRDTQATTLQALELVNGETLTHWLARGARKMLGQLPPDPVSIYDKPYAPKAGPQPIDIDISKADKLWLIVHDEGSYSPEKILAIWQDAELAGPGKTKPLGANGGLRVKTPSVEVLDIKGQGYTSLRGKVAMENQEITSDLNPHIRFLVFDAAPNMERLTPIAPETPLPPGLILKTPDEIVTRVFWYALGRAPSAAERTLALNTVKDPTRRTRRSPLGRYDETGVPTHMNRREFLNVTAAGTTAALVGTEPGLLKAAAPAPTADAVIILWMAGGMAQTETWDPKRYTPFEPGVRTEKVLSTFPAIDTAVDNIKISQGLERVAQVMDRASLIRTFQAADLGFILHSRHQYHWHTGYIPPQSLAMPHLGAVVAKTLGPRNPTVPPFIAIGQNLEIGGESPALKSFHTAGFLGTEFGPFLIADPQDSSAAVRPPADLGATRFKSRRKLYEALLAQEPVYQQAGDFQRESMIRSLDAADRLLTSPSAKAFDLSLEPKKSFDVYNNGRFGQGCLLARRLVEAGARYVEVTTEYIPFRYWDSHENGHERAETMKRQIDAPVAQLILDLEERGLLNRTLVVLASEFGRDAITEGKVGKEVKDQSNTPDVMTLPRHYGMHRHFTAAGSVVMWGGGVKRGFVYGKTADERPCTTIENPVSMENLHATIYRALGIAPDQAFIVEKRPVYVTKDGKGKPVNDLFA